MCRVAGYIGPRLRLAALVEEPPHSLLVQSYAAKELETSVVAADGWGASWYGDPTEDPYAYRSTLPIWGDVNRKDLNRAVESHCLLAAVRSATDPLSIAIANTQPFKFERLTFVHNGFLENFRTRWMRPIQNTLSDRAYQSLSGVSDSEHVFAMLIDEWLARAEAPGAVRLSQAVRATLARLTRLGEELGGRALLTLLVADGTHLVAVRGAHQATPPTLYMADEPGRGAVSFASEPLDAQRTWQPLGVGQIWLAKVGQPPVESEPS